MSLLLWHKILLLLSSPVDLQPWSMSECMRACVRACVRACLRELDQISTLEIFFKIVYPASISFVW